MACKFLLFGLFSYLFSNLFLQAFALHFFCVIVVVGLDNVVLLADFVLFWSCWFLVFVLDHSVVVLYAWCFLVLQNFIPTPPQRVFSFSVQGPLLVCLCSGFILALLLLSVLFLLLLFEFLVWFSAFPLQRPFRAEQEGNRFL